MARRSRPSKEEIIRTIINKMFEIAGHDVTFEQVADRKDAWYQEWTMTVTYPAILQSHPLFVS